MKSTMLYPIIASVMMMLATTGNLMGQDLGFTIKLDKTNYKKGEHIHCTMTIKNLGKKDVTINNRFLVNRPTGPHEVSLQLIDPNLKQVPFETKINADFNSNSFAVLHPGNTEVSTYIITEDFYLTDAGDYSVTAYYENTRNPAGPALKQPAWTGTLISNKVIFKLR